MLPEICPMREGKQVDAKEMTEIQKTGAVVLRNYFPKVEILRGGVLNLICLFLFLSPLPPSPIENQLVEPFNFWVSYTESLQFVSVDVLLFLEAHLTFGHLDLMFDLNS